MGYDLSVYIEYQLPCGRWVPVCNKLGVDESHMICPQTTPYDHKNCSTDLDDYFRDAPNAEKWGTFWRANNFHALLCPQHFHYDDTSWARDYPEFYQKQSPPLDACSATHPDMGWFTATDSWVRCNWATGNEVRKWLDEVIRVDKLSDLRETAFPGPKPEFKLTDYRNFITLEKYLEKVQLVTNIKDLSRIRMYFRIA